MNETMGNTFLHEKQYHKHVKFLNRDKIITLPTQLLYSVCLSQKQALMSKEPTGIPAVSCKIHNSGIEWIGLDEFWELESMFGFTIM